MAVFEGSVKGSTAGILLCGCGTVCKAAMNCTSGRLLSEKMDVLRLASYTAPVSCAVLLPLFVAVEVSFELVVLLCICNVPMHLYPQCLSVHTQCHTARREEVISAAK